jgi:hypothetical protein
MTAKPDELLDRLFAVYREMMGAFEPGPMFVAEVWAKIRSRRQEQHGWAAYLTAWAPRLALSAVAVAALLVGFLWAQVSQREESALLNATYVDTLALDSMDEQDGAVWVVARNGR